LSAQQFAHGNAFGSERLAQNWYAFIGIGFAAHKHVKRRVAGLRPSVNRDVTLGKNRHTGYTVWLKMVQMNMQQRRARGLDASSQRCLDMIDIVETITFVDIDYQMHAGSYDKMILALLRRRRRVGLFPLSGLWESQSLPRESGLAHDILPAEIADQPDFSTDGTAQSSAADQPPKTDNSARSLRHKLLLDQVDSFATRPIRRKIRSCAYPGKSLPSA
jgi:hypothetical protein